MPDRAAEGMLRYSDYSYSDIGNILTFAPRTISSASSERKRA